MASSPARARCTLAGFFVAGWLPTVEWPRGGGASGRSRSTEIDDGVGLAASLPSCSDPLSAERSDTRGVDFDLRVKSWVPSVEAARPARPACGAASAPTRTRISAPRTQRLRDAPRTGGPGRAIRRRRRQAPPLPPACDVRRCSSCALAESCLGSVTGQSPSASRSRCGRSRTSRRPRSAPASAPFSSSVTRDGARLDAGRAAWSLASPTEGSARQRARRIVQWLAGHNSRLAD